MLYYLATPYTKYAGGIEEAFVAAANLAGRLMQAGITCYSPIAHTHPLAIHAGIDPLDHGIWIPFDEAMMSRADALLIATMDGWEQSKGIAFEVEFFQRCEKPVLFVNPQTLRMTAEWPAVQTAVPMEG